MMQAQAACRVDHIFGNYVFSMRTIPGRSEENDNVSKQEEKALFEMIEDYIEQA